MLMNFGPINQRGGEKRLNVIFSRARHRMAIVTSIHSDAITNTHNDGASALKAFLQFAEASARGESERAQSILSTLNPGAQRSFATTAPTDPLRTALAKALRAKGHVVHEHVGSSQFRCDLAIVDETTHAYRLGIQLDSNRDSNSADVRDRYVFQPTVLRSFGWKVIDVPGKQWLADPAGLLARIEAALRDESPEVVEPEVVVEEIIDIPAPEPEVSPIATDLQEYRFEQGGSAKFWKIGVNGDELTVSFGRMGSKGQTLIKNFDTPEKAQREASKLIEEKVRKGYVEWPE
jgi:predicted DNA-binding WGR domain protein/very-short-patch-repair endonuclease